MAINVALSHLHLLLNALHLLLVTEQCTACADLCSAHTTIIYKLDEVFKWSGSSLPFGLVVVEFARNTMLKESAKHKQQASKYKQDK